MFIGRGVRALALNTNANGRPERRGEAFVRCALICLRLHAHATTTSESR